MWLALLLLPALAGFALLDLSDDDDSNDDGSEGGNEPAPSEPASPPADIVPFNMVAGDDYTGDSSDEVILGTESGDLVDGSAGDDYIYGEAGQDDLSGGTGDDTIDGGAWSDTLNGNGGDDALYGGQGNDAVQGGWGDDTVYLGDGDDLYGRVSSDLTEVDFSAVYAQGGDDTVYGGEGDDILLDIAGSNTLHGGNGNDWIDATDFEAYTYDPTVDINESQVGLPAESSDPSDTVNGGAGNDVLLVDNGDVVTGGEGADFIVVDETLGLNQDVVQITDFDPSEDVLMVSVFGDVPDPDNVSLLLVEIPNGDISVTFNGVPVANLQNLSAEDFPSDLSNIVFAAY